MMLVIKQLKKKIRWCLGMQTDIEIAQAAEVWPIEKYAEKAGLTPAEWGTVWA